MLILILNLFLIDGYCLERNDRNVIGASGNLKTGAGICVYNRENFNYRIISEMTISNKDIETLALRVNLDNVRSLLV